MFDFQIEDLLEIPEYRNFTWIGSGLQKHFGHITIAKQDVNHSVPAKKSSQLFEQVIFTQSQIAAYNEFKLQVLFYPLIIIIIFPYICLRYYMFLFF